MPPGTPSLLIFLHGMHAQGGQFREIAQPLQHTMPQTWIATPDAPFVDGGGRYWFSLDGLTEQNLVARLEEPRKALDSLLTRVIAEHGFSDLLDRVVLIGFSQGAVMALDAVASGRWAMAGVVSLAGRLITPEPLKPAPGARALLVHGKDDVIITADYTDQAYASLVAAGMSVERHVLYGVGHMLSRPVFDITHQFLQRILNQPVGLVGRGRIG